MMQVRRTSPAIEVEYFLDAAQDAGELDSCSAMVLRLYGDDQAIKRQIDLPVINTSDNHFRARRAKCLRLVDMADGILPELPFGRRSGLVNLGLQHIMYELEGMAECVSSWGIEDEIDGGCMIAWRDRPRCRNGVTFRRTNRRIRSPKYIRRYVRKEGPEAAEQLMVITRRMITRAKAWGSAADPTIMHDWRMQLNHLREVIARGDRRATQRTRKMIRRSLDTALSILGRETVSAFLRGEEIRLLGEQTMLTLRKRGSLADMGHGCLSVGMADRNGTKLADLCTFIEGTPMLDQLTGFALCMQAGEEQTVLDKANIISMEPAAREHPLMLARSREQHDRAVNDLAQLIGKPGAERIRELMGRPDRRRNGLTWEEKHARNQAYWQETKGQWLEAMMVLVIGYRDLPIFRQAGAL